MAAGRTFGSSPADGEDAVGPYFVLSSSEALVMDRCDSDGDSSLLNQLGYKQELGRRLSAFSNFAVTFSVVSILTGITTTYGTGLEFGGPATMIWGWPVVGLFTLVVGLSMAEICSSYPTSGGLYYWSAKLCSNEWSPFAAWITGWTYTLKRSEGFIHKYSWKE